MKNIYFLLFFISMMFSAMAQEDALQHCKVTCEIETQVGEGVFLGVQIESRTTPNAVKIVKIVEGTQAEKMGLQKGDIVESINDVPMTHQKFMVEWVGAQEAGMPVTVSFKRNGKPMELKGELGYKTVTSKVETVCCDDQITELELEHVKAFPNPSSGNFNLQFETKTDEPINIKIVDLSGNTVFEDVLLPNGGKVAQEIQLNTISGEHIIALEQNGKTMQHKIVVLK